MRQLTKNEINKRIESLQNLMIDSNIDGAYIVQNADMYYFSGAIIQGYVFIPAKGKAIHLVNKGYARTKEESFLDEIVQLKSPKDIPTILNSYGYNQINTIGFELDVLPYNHVQRFVKSFKEATIADISPLIKQVRLIKSDYEIAQIASAGQLSAKVFDEMSIILKEGISEIEILTHLEGFSKKNGSSGFMRTRGFNQEIGFILLASGKDAVSPSFCDGPVGGQGYIEGYPHGCSNQILTKGMPIILDYEGIINGYKSDMTRTFAIDSLPKHMIEAYELTYEINDFAKKHMKAGVLCQDIYAEAYNIVSQSKHKDFFMGFEKPVPYIGHGLGLEVDELPVIVQKNPTELMENMVIALEPKFLFEDGAVGIENTFQITKAEPVVLTPYNENIIIV